jgi:hypothetical protein
MEDGATGRTIHMKFMSQLVKAADEFQKVDWNLYDIRLTRLQLALAGKDDAKKEILTKRLERLYKQRAKTVWIKK